MIQNARHKGLGVIIHIVMNSGYIKPMSSQSRLYVMPFTEQLQNYRDMEAPYCYLVCICLSKSTVRLTAGTRERREMKGGEGVCVCGGVQLSRLKESVKRRGACSCEQRPRVGAE